MKDIYPSIHPSNNTKLSSFCSPCACLLLIDQQEAEEYNDTREVLTVQFAQSALSFKGKRLVTHTDFLQKIALTDKDTRDLVSPTTPRPCETFLCKYKLRILTIQWMRSHPVILPISVVSIERVYLSTYQSKNFHNSRYR